MSPSHWYIWVTTRPIFYDYDATPSDHRDKIEDTIMSWACADGEQGHYRHVYDFVEDATHKHLVVKDGEQLSFADVDYDSQIEALLEYHRANEVI